MLIDAAVSIKQYWRHPTNLIALEFGVVSFSFTALHNIFMLYFVDIFLFQYHLSFTWLWISQLCFVVWNFSSNYILGNPKQSSKYEMMITYGGPVLSIVFLLPFVFQISTSKLFIGVYFTLFLCLYDTLLNRVLLSRSIWLQENVVNMKDKLKIHFLGFIFASVASCSVFPSYLYYEEWINFRLFCFCISMLSFCGFLFSSFCHISREGDSALKPLPKNTTFNSSNHKPHKPSPSTPLLSSPSPSSPYSSSYSSPSYSSPSSPSSPYSSSYSSPSSPPSSSSAPYTKHTKADSSSSVSLGVLVGNVYQHKNMMIYLLVNLLQVFSSTYSVVFLQLFISRMVDARAQWQAFVLFICFFSPVLMNVVLSTFTGKRDTYDLLKLLFQAKIGISVFALVFGRHLFVAVLFTIFSRAIVESVFGLLMLVNQDVDNEHHVKFGYRKASQRLVSLGKIGQAAAPIVGVICFVVTPLASPPITSSKEAGAVISDFGLFYSTILVMLLSGGLQLYMWLRYNLHGSYLKDINVMAKGKLSSDLESGAPPRSSFGETLFANTASTPVNSPNLSSTATITHKQVIVA